MLSSLSGWASGCARTWHVLAVMSALIAAVTSELWNVDTGSQTSAAVGRRKSQAWLAFAHQHLQKLRPVPEVTRYASLVLCSKSFFFFFKSYNKSPAKWPEECDILANRQKAPHRAALVLIDSGTLELIYHFLIVKNESRPEVSFGLRLILAGSCKNIYLYTFWYRNVFGLNPIL